MEKKISYMRLLEIATRFKDIIEDNLEYEDIKDDFDEIDLSDEEKEFLGCSEIWSDEIEWDDNYEWEDEE